MDTFFQEALQPIVSMDYLSYTIPLVIPPVVRGGRACSRVVVHTHGNPS
jgi:hypothetical protein